MSDKIDNAEDLAAEMKAAGVEDFVVPPKDEIEIKEDDKDELQNDDLSSDVSPEQQAQQQPQQRSGSIPPPTAGGTPNEPAMHTQTAGIRNGSSQAD